MAAFSPAEDGRFYGYKDLAFLCANTVTGLFPLEQTDDDDSSSLASHTEAHREEDQTEELAAWVGYVFYRTIMPQTTVFHSLHLLLRLSVSGVPLPEAFGAMAACSNGTAPRNLLHYRLLLAAFILCTAYSMDDAYSNRSWAVASRLMFPLKQIDDMELSMMGALGWRLGIVSDNEDDERLEIVLARYVEDFEASLISRYEMRKSEQAALREHDVALRRQAKIRQILGPEVVSATLGHPENEGELRRLAKVHRMLGTEVGLLYNSTPTQFAFVVQDIPIEDLPPPDDAEEYDEPPPPLPAMPHRKVRKRRPASAGGSPAKPSRFLSQSPAAPFVGLDAPRLSTSSSASASPSAPAVANTVAVGTPAMATSSAVDACQCVLHKTSEDATRPPTAPSAAPLPCRWCLIHRAKLKLAHSKSFMALQRTLTARLSHHSASRSRTLA